MFRVAQADEQPLRAARFKKFFSLAVQDHERLAGFLFANLDVLPAQLRADARAERLRDRLLGRKPRGDERRGILVRETVGGFVRQQNPLPEPFAEFFQRRANSSDFDDVNAGS